MTDARGQESHFESWMTLNEGICDAIDALKALDKREPVAWMNDMGTHIDLNVSGRGMPLYTTPPQRKPLSDEEMKKIWYAMQNLMGWYSFQEIARAIEAAHGIK